MTFKEYIQNPTGIGTGVMSYRKLYEDLYHNKFSIIMTREAGKIDYTLWKDGDKYCYCYIKVPSEVVPKFYYDVIIKFKVNPNRMNLLDCDAQFFSNDPNFSYVFAYAFKKHNLTIPELEFKMSKRALNTKPSEKNPQLIINYIKSLYFAFIIMKDKDLFQRSKYLDAPQFDKKKFAKLVEDTDVKIQDRQNRGEELEKQNKRKNNTKASQKSTAATVSKVNNYISNTKNIGNVGSKFPINKPINGTVQKTVIKTPNKSIKKSNLIGRK